MLLCVMYMSVVVYPKEITEVEVETLKENLSTAHKRIEHLTEVNNVHMLALREINCITCDSFRNNNDKKHSNELEIKKCRDLRLNIFIDKSV